MPDVVLDSADPHEMLSHLLLYGAAAIAEDAGLAPLSLGWTGGMRPRPRLTGPDVDAQTLAGAVHRHAEERAGEGWLLAERPGTTSGLMSPRLARFDGPEEWRIFQEARQAVIDDLLARDRRLDLRLIAALGEPSSWHMDKRGKPLQDDAASRLEMQPRNRGSEFIGSRLRPLAGAVSARSVDQVRDGLLGVYVRDELGGDRVDSRTATGLRGPGPTDSAVAWTALWGVAQAPLALTVGRRAATAGHGSTPRPHGSFALPVWAGVWRTARLRTVLASAALLESATDKQDEVGAPDGVARRWLRDRGVVGVFVFPVAEFGSKSAPERRALRGRPLRLLG